MLAAPRSAAFSWIRTAIEVMAAVATGTLSTGACVMRTLVTGATGLVGNNVTRHLVAHGEQVRVLARPSSDLQTLDGLNVEIILGDITDKSAVRTAVHEVDRVIHAAGHIHFGRTQHALSHAVNVRGTRYIARAANEFQVPLVHISTVDALGAGKPNQPADEETSYVPKPRECAYVRSKRAAEAIVRAEVNRGLCAVIINPGLMLGPWDWKPSSARMLLSVAQQNPLVAPAGGITVCDIRDVTTAIVAAFEHGQPGRNYICAGENITFFTLWQQIADLVGSRRPLMPAGPLMRWVGAAAGDLVTLVTGREPIVNSASVKMSTLYHYYRYDRANRELGYDTRPLQESLSDTWQWLLEHGYTQPQLST